MSLRDWLASSLTCTTDCLGLIPKGRSGNETETLSFTTVGKVHSQHLNVVLSICRLTGNEIEQYGHLLNGGLPNDFTME